MVGAVSVSAGSLALTRRVGAFFDAFVVALLNISLDMHGSRDWSGVQSLRPPRPDPISSDVAAWRPTVKPFEDLYVIVALGEDIWSPLETSLARTLAHVLGIFVLVQNSRSMPSLMSHPWSFLRHIIPTIEPTYKVRYMYTPIHHISYTSACTYSLQASRLQAPARLLSSSSTYTGLYALILHQQPPVATCRSRRSSHRLLVWR